MRKKQAGTSMFIIVFMLVTCIFFVVLGFKSVPVVTEYFGIKKMITQLAAEGGNMSIAEIKESFTKKALVEYTGAISEDDLIIVKDGSNVSISAVYDKPVRLLGDDGANHFDLMFHFEIHEGRKPSKDSVSE